MARPALLLDVMSTLVYDPFAVEMPAFFGLSLAELLAQKHPTAWLAFERGELEEAAYLSQMFADGRRFDHDAFRAHIRGAYRLLEGIEPLLRSLQAAGVEMHALSNYPIWYQMLDEALGLSRWVPFSFVSCRTGVRKPDPEAYLGAARALGRDPAGCLFVDDREQNCAAARALGMPAICFTGAEALRAALIARGVLAA